MSEHERILREASKRAVTIDDTIRLFIGVDDAVIEAEIDKALRRGSTVTEGGVSRWIETFEVIDTTKSGADCFTWRGDKVLAEKVLLTKIKGEVTRKVIGTTFVNP